jgi:hypothetical protein
MRKPWLLLSLALGVLGPAAASSTHATGPSSGHDEDFAGLVEIDGGRASTGSPPSTSSPNVPSGPLQSSHFTSTGINVGTKLLRLNEGATGQGLAGNPRGKAEIVFDAGARSSLATERPGI